MARCQQTYRFVVLPLPASLELTKIQEWTPPRSQDVNLPSVLTSEFSLPKDTKTNISALFSKTFYLAKLQNWSGRMNYRQREISTPDILKADHNRRPDVRLAGALVNTEETHTFIQIYRHEGHW